MRQSISSPTEPMHSSRKHCCSKSSRCGGHGSDKGVCITLSLFTLLRLNFLTSKMEMVVEYLIGLL